jgi:flagellar assembly protein FliH
MSSGNLHQERLHEELDAAIEKNAPSGKLEDAEIQRLVQLSNDASYQRSERVPVKTVEAFEPRSLVSIAMAAQRRRETELRTAVAAGAVLDEAATDPAKTDADLACKAGEDAAVEQPNTDEAGALDASPNAAGETTGDAEGSEGEAAEEAPSSTSQVDFEAGRAEGLEEGRRAGFDEGKATGLEEGRTAGRAEASAQLERVIQAFEAATSKLADLTAVDSDALAASINEVILRLASERAGHAIAEQPDSFTDRIEALLAMIQTVSGQPSIRLNPADLASIQPLADTREKLRHCNFVADESLAHGDLSVMVGTIGIDDIIVPSEAAAENTGKNATDDMGEKSVTEAKVAAMKAAEFIEAAEAVDVKGAADEVETKTDADTVAVDSEQPQDGDQDV